MDDELYGTFSQTLKLATRRLIVAMQTGTTAEDAKYIRNLSAAIKELGELAIVMEALQG